MRSDFEMRRQIEHQVLQRHVLEKLGFGKWGLASGTVLAAAEGSVQVENDVAKYVAKQKKSKKIVTEELKIRGIYKRIK